MEGVLEPIVGRYLKLAVRLLFRAEAAFAKPELYEYVESKSIGYIIMLPANQVLQREIAHLLARLSEWSFQSLSSPMTTPPTRPRVGMFQEVCQQESSGIKGGCFQG